MQRARLWLTSTCSVITTIRKITGGTCWAAFSIARSAKPPVRCRRAMSVKRVVLELRVNGGATSAIAEPRTLLSDHLRHGLGLTGVHVGCEHGVCGACTVLMNGKPVRSCIMFAVQARG